MQSIADRGSSPTWSILSFCCCCYHCCPVPKSCVTLKPHGLQHAGLPCPSLSPGLGSNSYPLSWWCCLTISSFTIPFYFCLQSFPAFLLQFHYICTPLTEFNLQFPSLPQKVKSEVAHSCPTLLDCSPPGSSIHGIFQARILERVAISFFRGSFPPRNWTSVSYIAGRFFTDWATREFQYIHVGLKKIMWFEH